MRDIHSHILPGVDDGAPDIKASLEMLEAAKAAGVTSIVCTPHCREPFFDYAAMNEAFRELTAAAPDFPFTMGFEVNHSKLMDLGLEEWAPKLGVSGSNDFLLELSSRCTADDCQDSERTILALQALGYRVIVAHPERYRAIQEDLSLAQRLIDLGCRLQASADFIDGGRLGREKKPATRLFNQMAYSFVASDAHRPEHYEMLGRIRASGNYRLRPRHMRVPSVA